MPPEPITPSPPPIPWYFTRSAVFILIFLVAGAFALPFLWLSRAFSTVEKTFWSFVATVYTVILILVIIAMCLYLWHLWKMMVW